MGKPIPTPTPESGLRALKAMITEKHPLAAMQVFHRDLGDIFRVNLPGFKPVVMVGPEAARFVLAGSLSAGGRENLLWRNETDPVTRLLGHGVLVTDGDEHDLLRKTITPALHRKMLDGYLEAMLTRTEEITSTWRDGEARDMLVEMRKIALLILMDTLYRVDFTPHLQPLWKAILGDIGYISPGIWMLWKGAPRPQYDRAIRQVDAYLYQIIRERRETNKITETMPMSETGEGVNANGESPTSPETDLLGLLIQAGLDDTLIRDQLLTMLIAGHDTSTALLAWTLYLLGAHPKIMAEVQAEILSVSPQPGPVEPAHLQQYPLLDRVIRESLRLYPPIHLGSRVAARDVDYQGYTIPAGERVIYSIYLTQRDPNHWDDPNTFNPDRHLAGRRDQGYTWLAFGGGPRNCIGAAYGQVEVKAVLAHILRSFKLTLLEKHVHPHMGATLEPRPGVRMRIEKT